MSDTIWRHEMEDAGNLVSRDEKHSENGSEGHESYQPHLWDFDLQNV